MGRNGKGHPPRPRIEVLASSSASESEAAAVVVAVEQFLVDTAPGMRPGERINPWQRAALLEGVRSKEAFASPWGEPMSWGRRHSHNLEEANRWR